LKHLPKAARDDEIFTGLQHPDAYDNGVFGAGDTVGILVASGWIQFDARSAVAQVVGNGGG
jgi:hypothetical protein